MAKGQEGHADHTHKGGKTSSHENTVPQAGTHIEVGQQVRVQGNDVSHGHEGGQARNQFGLYIRAVFFQFENFF